MLCIQQENTQWDISKSTHVTHASTRFLGSVDLGWPLSLLGCDGARLSSVSAD